MPGEISLSLTEKEIQVLKDALAKATQEAAVAKSQIEMMTRQVEDLRLQNYRLDAQFTECRIARAVADERAAAAREAAGRRDCHHSCGASPNVTTIYVGGLPGSGYISYPLPTSTTPEASTHGGTATGSTTTSGTPATSKKLIIEKMVVQQTPQSGTWLMCFMAKAQGGAQNVFNIPNKEYKDDGITIDMNLQLSPVAVGEKINFKCNLDDDQSDVCSETAEDKSSGEFLASEIGSQVFSFDNWVYTLYWHME